MLFKIIIFLYVISSVIIFFVDYSFFLKDRYCRFRIGRWNSDEVWIENVFLRIKKWLTRVPTVKISDNSRYILFDIFQGKYRSNSIQSWQNASLLLALFEKEELQLAEKFINKFIDENGQWIIKPTAVDSSMLAYAILKTTEDKEVIKPAMNQMIEVVDKCINSKGIISYTGKLENSDSYVDTLGLVCPFLVLYAKIYNKPYYEQLAFEQILFYAKNGLLADTQLPNHAIDCISHKPLGVYGWGRGVGWYVIGLLDTYKEIVDFNKKEKLKDLILLAAEDYINYQHNDGGFGSILQRVNTYDSSATASLAYFYAECARIFSNEKYKEVSLHCLNKLKSVTRITGTIDYCQGDTKDIGVFSKVYDIMPFAQGLTLRAYLINYRGK